MISKLVKYDVLEVVFCGKGNIGNEFWEFGILRNGFEVLRQLEMRKDSGGARNNTLGGCFMYFLKIGLIT